MSILVFAENWDGKFKKITFEAVSYASALAKALNTTVSAITIGSIEEAELKKLGTYGANKILTVTDDRLKSLVNHAYSSVISQAAVKENASVVILANNLTGKAIASRISVNLKAGLASGVISLPSADGSFAVKRKVYNGKAIANIIIKTPVKILTLFQNAFGLNESQVDSVIESFTAELNDTHFRTQVTETHKLTGKLLLTDAEIVVSGGRGMRGPENWGPIEELAGLLGAATACSRPVSDEGWRPHEEHTGQTGKVIAPTLYIACGISGAMQHLAGVSSSKVIVAINKDPDAPIFEAADYGIVGDVLKVLPEFIAAVKELKSLG